jgi:peptide/nickel transport system ATP-binding protein
VSAAGPTLIDIEDLAVTYRLQRTRLFSRAPIAAAVRRLSLEIGANETVGLVGESGSGKSTTGRAVVGLVPVSGGDIKFKGESLVTAPRAKVQELRRRLQMVFQDPYGSLDPTMRVIDVVAEPLDARGGLSRSDRRERVEAALRDVGLHPQAAQRHPSEFSGGQRQRIAIARSLVIRPEFVVCDEPVSALDVSTKNQIVVLLQKLQAEHGCSYMLISHDLPIVRHISSRIAVMYAGRIVEQGPARRVVDRPAHPYTMALVSASPYPNPARERARPKVVLTGDPPSPTWSPAGCAFAPRCPFAMDVCREELPALTPVEGGGLVACHLQTAGPKLNGSPLAASLKGLHVTQRATVGVD